MRKNDIDNYNDRINSQWRKFLSDEIVVKNIVPDEVLESWKICTQFDVDPIKRKEPHVLTQKEINLKIDRNSNLIHTAIPFMEKLFNYIQGSGYVVTLADTDGYLLHLIGDQNAIEEAQKASFIAGACWNEENAGSNAVGSVLRTGSPLQVFASEHFCSVSHQWTCCGAPIYCPEGAIMGVISMIGPYYKYNHHSLGIVVAAANAIENAFKLQSTLNDPSNNGKAIQSSSDSIVIGTDNNLIVTMANNNTISAFGLQPRIIIGRSLEENFGPSNKDFVNLIKQDIYIHGKEVKIISGQKSRWYSLTTSQMENHQQSKPGKLILLQEMTKSFRPFIKTIVGLKNNHRTLIIGENPRFLESLRLAETASQSASNVLLLGESGTGKEVFSHFIHSKSPKNKGPFIAINCAAIPKDLIASELFGYEDGAFTGSRKGGSPGKFELANGGTLLLDEIGEMPLELQASLLRVLEEKKVTRIGGKQQKSLDVRIITATNKNLQEEVNKGAFRTDLYYRINVFTIRIIPLRERKDDIPIFVSHFLQKINQEMGKQIQGIDDQFLHLLSQYDFPGNVRELQNIIERAVNLASTDTLTPDLLPLEIRSCTYDQQSENALTNSDHAGDDIESDLLNKLIKSGIPKTEIAKRQNISRRTLYRKLKKYSLI